MTFWNKDKPKPPPGDIDAYPTLAKLQDAGHPDNPRIMSEKQRKALEDSMLRYGDLSGIVFNWRTGRLVCGHQRIAAMPEDSVPTIENTANRNDVGTIATGYISDGTERWPYRVVDVTEELEAEMMIAANAHGGEWNLTVLEAQLSWAAESLAVGAGSSLERQLKSRKRAREKKAESTTPKGTSKVFHECPECGHTWSA